MDGMVGRPSNQDILFKQCQVDFTAYNIVTNGVNRAEKWKATPFHNYLCKRVQKFVETESTSPYDIMVINTPPQHGKSISVTETLPSWYLGRHPEKRVIEISYNADYAQKFGRRNREKIETFGGPIFGVGLSSSSKSLSAWELDNGVGGMLSVGYGGPITGQPGHLIIIDDPIKNASEAKSEVARNKLYDEWVQTIRTRTHPGSKIILIMTRWHDDDLAGRLLAEEDCEYINLPVECDDENDEYAKYLKMKYNITRKIGDALCPEIGKDNKWLEEFKRRYTETEGISAWYAMFQGRPVAEGGNIIKKEWWQYYEVSADAISSMDELVMSVDAAFKDTGDPVCIQVWGRKRANLYLVDMINDRLDFVKTVSAIKGMKGLYPKIRQILIEDKANGSAVIATLRNEIPGIIPVEPYGGKEARVNAVTYIIESKNVYLPENRMYTREFVQQCSAFPNGKHDDMVDAMSQALSRMMAHKTHDKRQKQPSIMDFFSKKPDKPKSKIGNGERINVI